MDGGGGCVVIMRGMNKGAVTKSTESQKLWIFVYLLGTFNVPTLGCYFVNFW